MLPNKGALSPQSPEGVPLVDRSVTLGQTWAAMEDLLGKLALPSCSRGIRLCAHARLSLLYSQPPAKSETSVSPT